MGFYTVILMAFWLHCVILCEDDYVKSIIKKDDTFSNLKTVSLANVLSICDNEFLNSERLIQNFSVC